MEGSGGDGLDNARSVGEALPARRRAHAPLPPPSGIHEAASESETVMEVEEDCSRGTNWDPGRNRCGSHHDHGPGKPDQLRKRLKSGGDGCSSD